VQRVLIQADREVSDAYQAHGTPTAVVISSDGVIRSPTVGGAESIRTLVARASAPVLAVTQVPSSNGHADGDVPPAPALDTSRVGQPAPELVLSDLDGQRVALKDLYDEHTVAIFWNPGCGFCQAMLPDLKALEDDPPAGAPRIVVISSGEREAVRELQLRSRVLLDSDGEAMRAFSAGGTPMAVLIDKRRIATPVAAGAGAVFDLIRAGSRRGEALTDAANGSGNAP
jgi:thiol-disulfide isomerase/thioredoxin